MDAVMVDAPELLPHQKRVVAEKAELDEKLEKLKAFITGPKFSEVPEPERGRLTLQHNVMNAYSLVLGMRIDAF